MPVLKYVSVLVCVLCSPVCVCVCVCACVCVHANAVQYICIIVYRDIKVS